MAIKYDNSQLNIEIPWDGQTGEAIEDYISRNIPTSIVYDKETQILKLVNNINQTIAQGSVTVETPEFRSGILILGIRVNGKVCTNKDTLITQYTNNTKIELAIAAFSTARYSTGESDTNIPVETTIEFGQGNTKVLQVDTISLDKCKVVEGQLVSVSIAQEEWHWYNITDLFKSTVTSTKITATAGKATSQLNISITNQVIALQYTGQYITSNTISFILTGGDVSEYHLEGFNGDQAIQTSSGILQLTTDQLNPGLNQLSIRAINNSEQSVFTDYLYVNIINTVGFNDSAVAINGINDSIKNNDTSQIYRIDAYSANKDSISVNTYLEDVPQYDNPQPTQLLESITITAQNYTDGVYSSIFSKYIEINSNNAFKHLVVKVNDDWYHFYEALGNTITYGNSTALQVTAINNNFTYTANPYLNFDQINGRSNNIFTTDKWVTDNDRTVYRVEANSGSVFNTPFNLSLSNEFTLEFGLKTYNVSDESKYIISLVNSGTSYFQIRPTTVCWNTTNIDLFNARNSQFQEGVDTHIVITMLPNYRVDKNDPYYPTYLQSSQSAFDNYTGTINLLRIYINGVIDREIALSDSELKYLQGCSLQINPTTSDLDLYVLRVYNTKALDFDEVKHNYLSFFKTYNEKETFYNKNDIVGDNGTISFQKAVGKYNTLLYVFPKGGIFPNRFWAGADNTTGAQDSLAKKLPVTLFINYADTDKNLKYGGRITNGLVKGQGSSAMRYLIWNVSYQLNKMKDSNGDTLKSVFTPYSQLVAGTNKFKENPDTTSGYYNMPYYDGQYDSDDSKLKITKLVGKVNFASSMQSHKEGACKLYNDAYKSGVTNTLVSGGRKAVQEETFLYFYIETDLDSVDNIELADVLERNDIKFMGIQTWGSAKGDDATFGYDSKTTPEYLLLEGGENTDPHVQFRRPWQALQRGSGTLGDPLYKLDSYPTVTSEESLKEPWKNLLILDESITYTGDRGAWDIDYGVEEVTAANGNTYFQIKDSVKPSLKKFREFLDFVYLHDYTMKVSNEKDTSSWDQNYKYCCTNPSLTEFSGHRAGNVYRYDDINNKWVNAGTSYDNGGWSVFNLFDFTGVANQNFKTAIGILKKRFSDGYTDTNDSSNSYSGISAYVDVNDIAFHQAFIRFLSGTDNRAKNTYFQIIGRLYEQDSEGNYQPKAFSASYTEEDAYRARLLGDDLDTIIITDNNGLQSKAYNLLEPSYAPETASQWGDNGLNKFFYMFDQLFEGTIKEMLKRIIKYAFSASTSQDNTNNNFYKFFYSIQKDKIPAVVYNHTAKIYYEVAQQIYNSNVFTYYKNNGIQPIEQSHGACVEGEMHFMKKRYNFLASYAQQGMGGVELDTTSSAGSGGALALRIAFTPFQDFYPNYLYNNNTYKYYGELNDSDYGILRYMAQADKEYTINIKENSTAINQGLLMLDCFKKFDITGLTTAQFSPRFDRVTNFTVDNANIVKYPELFGSDFPKLAISDYNAKLPVVEELNLKNISLPDTMDLSTYTKLRTLNLSGSTVKRVILPSNVQDITLPTTIETFELYNPVNSITFEGYDNIKVVYIDNIDLFNNSKFDVIDFCNKVTQLNQLESITLHNLNNDISLDTLQRLLQVNVNLTGTIRVVNSIGNLAPISFTLKQKLIDKFGNIDNQNNSLYVQYQVVQTNTVLCEPQVNIYGQGYSGNPFNLSVDGNDVAIIKNNDQYIPDITYTMTISDSSIATINSRTGVITLLKESGSVTAKVTISVKTTNNITKTSNECELVFTWKAPQLGDFVYADGTYTSSYNKDKTVMGLVYYVNTSGEQSGTAYVVGAQYVGNDSFYVGYCDGGNINTGDTSLQELGRVKNYLESILSIENYQNVPNVSNNVDGSGTIDYSKTSNVSAINNSGKEDTKAYVDHVSQILEQLKNSYSSYISGDRNNGYYIATYEQLTSLLNDITNAYPSSSKPIGAMQCLLFPYFYATYLWEPSVKDSEKTTFNEQFKAGNWYVPSYEEMRRLIYYRGLSAGGGKFVSTDVEGNIGASSDLNMFDNTNVPIFAKACQAGFNLPTCWKSLVGTNNLCSTANGDQNYAYMSVQADYSGSFTYQWILGYYDGVWRYGQDSYTAAWRLTKHRPLPCVQFKYSKNG